ncbi:MAG: 4-hydroxy-tetrahydrodipicolinate reductase, partial [Ruminococcaceae bacterium]|nr:4-hydroxy-tetrahydrodipicolinate reductase [Oscillospiraceae bacterium]
MKIIINGAGGRMGREVARLIEAPDECVAKIDKYNTDPDMLKSLFEYEGEADVIIDFSYPVATPEILKYAEKRGIPLVIATTGHTDAVKEMISEASKHIPIFFSANMSLGVALLVNLTKQAAKAFPDADIE